MAKNDKHNTRRHEHKNETRTNQSNEKRHYKAYGKNQEVGDGKPSRSHRDNGNRKNNPKDNHKGNHKGNPKGNGKGYANSSNNSSKNKKNNKHQEMFEPMSISHKPDTDVTIPCPYFKSCGGCQLLDVTYEKSLALKQEAIQNRLKGFGKVNPIIGMDEPYAYRNKSVSTFGERGKKGFISGLYQQSTHEIVPIERCLIQDERADEIVNTIRSLMKSFKMTAYDEQLGRGFLRHVLIRVGHQTGQIMVVMVTTTPIFPGKKNFMKVLRERHPEIDTLVMNVNDKETTMVLGNNETVLFGKGYIQDELCGLTFRISPSSFYQINVVQTERLYNKAMEMASLTETEKVLDAYSGIGTIGLIAAKDSEAVIGVELNANAVRDAISNSKYNKIQNARFYQGDAGDYMVAMAQEGEKLDVVFMDPPRSGSTRAFIKALGIAKPPKVVYVSCGPESLARDLKWLEEEGYKVCEIQPVDMFPWTEHVENVVLLKRSF